MNRAITNQEPVTGSLASVAKANHQSLAETFLSADAVVLIDVSSSMSQRDAGEQTRYERACSELAQLQNTLPGKIAVISFASEPMFCPSGIPQQPCGMTDLAKALRFTKVADVADMRFIVISDGDPDSEREALDVAAQYVGRIDVIYVGHEGGSGQKFLQRLAKSKGGQSITAESAKELSAAAQYLLQAGA
jgi:Mg-chelatase subunit ChlD